MRRVIIRTAVAALVVVLGIGVLAGFAALRGGGSDVTRPRLERALAVTFANTYVQQARLLGRPDITAASLQPKAMCDKHGPHVADIGPGGDWTCLMSWEDPNVAMPPEGYGKFELNVHSNSCFTAAGPSKLTGFLTLTDVDGHEVTNPLFEFDGCFDPGGANSPTGVEFPSALNISSTTLTPDSEGHLGVQLTCGTGAAGCAGTLSGDASLGSAQFHMVEESSLVVPLPGVLPADATQVVLTLERTVGAGNDAPVTILVTR
jgi:hypothetical protein